MTTEQKIARRKLSLLELASDLGNVSKACKVIGYSRQQFYEIRRNFQKRPAIFVKYYFGVRALLLLPLFPGAFALEDQRDSRHGEAS